MAFKKCQSLISDACELVRAEDLTIRAYNIAVETWTAFYDSLFLAEAEVRQVPLLTLDRKLMEMARSTWNVQLIWAQWGIGFALRSTIMECRGHCG
jgi:predicted nucleic acid-binding protein